MDKKKPSITGRVLGRLTDTEKENLIVHQDKRAMRMLTQGLIDPILKDETSYYAEYEAGKRDKKSAHNATNTARSNVFKKVMDVLGWQAYGKKWPAEKKQRVEAALRKKALKKKARGRRQ